MSAILNSFDEPNGPGQTSLPELVAAVDLGSNSFHLLIGRVTMTPAGPLVTPLDSLKESVRLAAGLSKDKRLDVSSQARAVATLQRFGERLRAFHPDHVRVVATNTFRVAKNGPEFQQTCEAALGFPIEVIAGREEARLIYNGVSHSLAADGRRRLVVDIGGGSTEFIIGTNYTPELLESVFVGCIRFSQNYFPGGEITRSGFKEAVLEARREIQVLTEPYRTRGWDEAVGSSGTAKALADLMPHFQVPVDHGITREGLELLRAHLIREGTVSADMLPGLKADRVPVISGGLSIMLAIFEELDLQQMHYADGALRLGVLYDVLGRGRKEDIRPYTVSQMVQRYQTDRAQSQRVSRLAQSLFLQSEQIASLEERTAMAELLGWSADLLEVGLSISHSSFHKHSAYIVSQADMPGFSRRDQRIMGSLILGHTGKLGKVQAGLTEPTHLLALASLRLASIFYRSRIDADLPSMSLRYSDQGFTLAIDQHWMTQHPLTLHSLEQEGSEWRKVGLELKII